MRVKYLLLVVGALLLAGGAAQADESLKSSLSLNMDQARQVDTIQAKYRKQFAAKRQELNKEMRALRRAKLANDSSAVARQEKITAKLRDELRAIRARENDEIRAVLTPEQRVAFEDVLKKRKEMVGSSRDEREL